MTEEIFIGADGGGSKIVLRIENQAGDLLGMGRGGPAQLNLSVEQAYRSVYDALNIALSEASLSLDDPDYHFKAGLGLAGCEIQSAQDAFLKMDHPFDSIELFSDAYGACVGAHAGHDGAIIIVGTGVIGFQVCQGHVVQVGGWGFPHDDLGGGAWLGKELVKLTLQWHDGRQAPSPIFDVVLERFDQDILNLVHWANRSNSTDFATLAPLVIQHLDKEDSVAIHLMKQAAAHVDAIAVALQKQLPEGVQEIPICLFGGVSSFIQPWLSYPIRKKITPRQYDASKGAIMLIRERQSK